MEARSHINAPAPSAGEGIGKIAARPLKSVSCEDLEAGCYFRTGASGFPFRTDGAGFALPSAFVHAGTGCILPSGCNFCSAGSYNGCEDESTEAEG